MARGFADANGDFTLVVELPDLGTGGGVGTVPKVFAYVDQPGYQVRPRASLLQTEDGRIPERIELLVQARRGATVRGILLDSAEQPVPKASVVLYQFQKEQPDEVDYRNRTSVHTGRTGAFEAHIQSSGDWQLRARAPGLGVASLRDFWVDIMDPPQDLRLQLEGPGVLAGRVVDPNGEPMKSYKVWAIVGDPPKAGDGYDSNRMRQLHEWEGGLHDAAGMTDAQGFFRLSGLKQESYRIRGTQAESRNYGALLTKESVPAGTEDLLLQVQRHRVRLSLRDSTGGKVAFGNFIVRGTNHGKAPSIPCVYVAEADEAGRVLVPGKRTEVRRSMLDPFSQVIEVEPGKRYVFGVLSSQFELQEHVLLVPHEPYVIDLELQLGRAQESGIIELEVQDPWGQPFEGDTHVLLRAPSGKHLFASRYDHSGSEHMFTLAPGVYQVEARANSPEWSEPQENRSALFAVTTVKEEIQVFSGRTQRIPVRLGRAGWVDLEVALEPPVSKIPFSSFGSEVSRVHCNDHLRRPLGGIAVRFEPIGGGSALGGIFNHRDVLRPQLPRDSGFRDFHSETSWILPNRVERAIEALPAGSYLCIFEREGYETKTVPFEVYSREVTHVQAQLNLLSTE